MRILCIDVGTGTQDILLFDSSVEIENCMRMVMPSPTRNIARRVHAATRAKHTLLLSGVTMGGGPGAWAVEEHIKAGLAVYSTTEAARTFDDDLDRVSEMGVRLISLEDLLELWEDLGPRQATRLELTDANLREVETALRAFDEPADFDGLAVAAFDHGAAPPGYSDRRFRFDYISRQMARWGGGPLEQALAAFAAPAGTVNPGLTRLLAVAGTARTSRWGQLPLLLMDTGPAALLGTMDDPVVTEAAQERALFVNVGNFHTLAFHIVGGRIRGLFEHHTGMLDAAKLVALLERLSEGALTNEEVFEDSGHGALTLQATGTGPETSKLSLVAVTGPRRSLLRGVGTPWPVYFAVPHGDMMLAGCYGLLRAYARHFPASAAEILPRLDDGTV